PLRLVVAATSEEEFLRECDQAAAEFNLDPLQTEFVPCIAADSQADSTFASRDDLVVKMADILVPVSCRASGSMAIRLAEAERSGRDVRREFSVEYSNKSTALKYELSNQTLSPNLDGLNGKYLIHWTRGTSFPWPGERRISFYRAIIQSDRWPRAASDTLARIMKKGTILSSGRHMPGGIPTVSFSALAPREVVPLMRWRARYGEMSFEPYGIGIDCRVGRDFGIREVIYYDAGQPITFPTDQLWRSQSNGKITDWTAEREYRCLGDLSLREVPPESMALFCMTTLEAEVLRQEFGCPAWSFLP
ncbi:MAG: hypothetical protein NTW07_10130, partial [candidate division Zixibacteria bacterium]|nr:hypothetical protein [candidate division Zixibacteria bacterium]